MVSVAEAWAFIAAKREPSRVGMRGAFIWLLHATFGLRFARRMVRWPCCSRSRRSRFSQAQRFRIVSGLN